MGEGVVKQLIAIAFANIVRAINCDCCYVNGLIDFSTRFWSDHRISHTLRLNEDYVNMCVNAQYASIVI